jgi:hypothetical protein
MCATHRREIVSVCTRTRPVRCVSCASCAHVGAMHTLPVGTGSENDKVEKEKVLAMNRFLAKKRKISVLDCCFCSFARCAPIPPCVWTRRTRGVRSGGCHRGGAARPPCQTRRSSPQGGADRALASLRTVPAVALRDRLARAAARRRAHERRSRTSSRRWEASRKTPRSNSVALPPSWTRRCATPRQNES